MLKKRLIAVIIVKDNQVVQSIKFKHTNVIHSDAKHAMVSFNDWDIDEIILLNVSRDRSSQSSFLDAVRNASRYCFVPLAVGGFVDSEDYASELLRSGADKIVLNTAIYLNPNLIQSLSNKYGAQCLVGSIDIKQDSINTKPTVWIDRGRVNTGEMLIPTALRAQSLGIGEIMLNSIDHDGARKGYALESLSELCASVSIPVIAFGGVFTWKDLLDGVNAGADAVAAANIFHYTEQSTRKAKSFLANSNISVRKQGQVHNFSS